MNRGESGENGWKLRFIFKTRHQIENHQSAKDHRTKLKLFVWIHFQKPMRR